MERKSYYLIILLVAFVICIGVFWFQFNNDVATFIMINETEVAEGESFKPMKLVSSLLKMPNIYLMQAKIITMVISHLQVMTNIRVAHMRVM